MDILAVDHCLKKFVVKGVKQWGEYLQGAQNKAKAFLGFALVVMI